MLESVEEGSSYNNVEDKPLMIDGETIKNAHNRRSQLLPRHSSNSLQMFSLPVQSGFRSARSSVVSDPGILMLDIHTEAHKLDGMHKFHAFILYHPGDRQWVLTLVKRLESEPYCYKVCYDLRNFKKNISDIQNTVNCIMLSERIILVLSGQLLSNWKDYSDIILPFCSPSNSSKRKLFPISLGDCFELPSELNNSAIINANWRDFFEKALISLKHDSILMRESTSTVWSVMSHTLTSPNGHLLVLAKGKLMKRWHLQPSFCYSIEFAKEQASIDLLNTFLLSSDVNRIIADAFQKTDCLTWRLSSLPIVFFSVFFFIWMCLILVVIWFFSDFSTSTALICKLVVFVIPGILLTTAFIVRWKLYHREKELFSRKLFMNTIHVNGMLYNEHKPFISTMCYYKRDQVFQMFLMYYNSENCIDHIRLYLTNIRLAEMRKLKNLITVYSLDDHFLENKPINEQLAVMMAASYGLDLMTQKLPAPVELRHNKKSLCLCQFVEDFLAAYLPMLRHFNSFTTENIEFIFLRYLNCSIKLDNVVIQTLGLRTQQDVMSDRVSNVDNDETLHRMLNY